MSSLEPIWQPGPQRAVFRAVLEAASHPGDAIALPAELSTHPAHEAVLAALTDESTTLADIDALLSVSFRRRLAAPSAPEGEAQFLLAQGGTRPKSAFRPRTGDVYQPHRGATIILAGGAVGTGGLESEVSGPGVEATRRLRLAGFHELWIERRNEWIADYPAGVDLFLCDPRAVVALPRTTRLRVLASAP